MGLKRKSAIAACFAGLGAVGSLAGCGSDEKAPGSGAAAVKYPPIRLDQPRARAGTPGEVVVRLWSRLRDGALPLALNAYRPEVVARVGREPFIGGLNVMRDTVTPFAPLIVRTEAVERQQPVTGEDRRRRRPAGALALVYVEGRGSQGAVLRATFLLERSTEGWAVLHDTVMDSALRVFVATSRQHAPEESERLRPDPAAQAGAAVARRFQSAANGLTARSF